MATNPIYVETEEEIPEVVERLRRFNGDDTMLVLPIRSRVGQSRFNFQLLRNYASRMGKRVTVVCDDPAVQKMASESGFPVFGAVGMQGEGIPSEPATLPPPKRWWERGRRTAATHIDIAPPTKLLTKNATELKPGRFLLYVAAATLLVVGLFAIVVYVPSASVTLVAQAQPFSQKAVEIQAQPGKPPVRVRPDVVVRSNSQGFKTTGLIQVVLAPAFGVVTYTNTMPPPTCPGPDCGARLIIPWGQRLDDTTDSVVFAQTSNSSVVPWAGTNGPGTVQVNVIAVKPGNTGNVGNGMITKIEGNTYGGLTVTNLQATGGGTDASSKPVMTVADFDAARAVLEQELRQTIAQEIIAAGKPNEKLSDTMIFGPPQFSTDHQPTDAVPSFNATMTLQGEGDFYVDADVHKAFETYLSQRVPNNEQLLTDSPIQVDYRLLSATKGGFLTFVGEASAFVAPKLDLDHIRAQLVGRPLAQARFFLQGLNVKSLSIKEQPITLPIMPLLVGRISIHYQVEPGAQLTTPGPTP